MIMHRTLGSDCDSVQFKKCDCTEKQRTPPGARPTCHLSETGRQTLPCRVCHQTPQLKSLTGQATQGVSAWVEYDQSQNNRAVQRAEPGQ